MIKGASRQGSGPHVDIVRLLEEYRRDLPIDFVAETLSRSDLELSNELAELQRRGAVELVGDSVRLKQRSRD